MTTPTTAATKRLVRGFVGALLDPGVPRCKTNIKDYGAHILRLLDAIEAEAAAAALADAAAKVRALDVRHGSEHWGAWQEGVNLAAVLAILEPPKG